MRSVYSAPAVAGGLIAAGVVFLFFGWKGAAATLFIPTQIAFGVSGSLTGIAVIGVGLTVLAVHTTRLHTAQRTRDLRRLVGLSVEIMAAVRQRTESPARDR